jgi:type I restriction enzyme M protein
VILPLLILRRLDAVLQPTKAKVFESNVKLEGKTSNPDPLLKRATGQPLYKRAPRGPVS